MTHTSPLSRRRSITLFVGVVMVLLCGVGCEDRVVYPPGVWAPDEPEQTAIEPRVVYEDDDFTVTAVATFHLQAKVLSRERYRSGREAELSPIDFALGWKRMSDQPVVDEFKITQQGRWYTWRSKGSMPIPKRDVERCSANMHMLTKDAGVREALLAVRTGEIVAIEGYLVRVSANDGWNWSSSTTRGDTGNGACEVVWVDSFEVVKLGASR